MGSTLVLLHKQAPFAGALVGEFTGSKLELLNRILVCPYTSTRYAVDAPRRSIDFLCYNKTGLER